MTVIGKKKIFKVLKDYVVFSKNFLEIRFYFIHIRIHFFLKVLDLIGEYQPITVDNYNSREYEAIMNFYKSKHWLTRGLFTGSFCFCFSFSFDIYINYSTSRNDELRPMKCSCQFSFFIMNFSRESVEVCLQVMLWVPLFF